MLIIARTIGVQTAVMNGNNNTWCWILLNLTYFLFILPFSGFRILCGLPAMYATLIKDKWSFCSWKQAADWLDNGARCFWSCRCTIMQVRTCSDDDVRMRQLMDRWQSGRRGSCRQRINTHFRGRYRTRGGRHADCRLIRGKETRAWAAPAGLVGGSSMPCSRCADICSLDKCSPDICSPDNCSLDECSHH